MFELKVIREWKTEYGEVATIRSAKDVYRVFQRRANRLDREEFLTLLLDTKNQVLGFNSVSVGCLTATVVHPREVFKPAVIQGAASIILIHNHPSGDPKPSSEDAILTKRLRDGGKLLGIQILDHIIIGHQCFYSFTENE